MGELAKEPGKSDRASWLDQYVTPEQRQEFWALWIEADQEPINIRKQIIKTVSRYNKFQFTDWNLDSFIFDVIERCIMAYPNFNSNKSAFVSWVVMNARSVAFNIINTSKVKTRGSITGRGLRWPYNSRIERAFVDFVPEGVDIDDVDIEEMMGLTGTCSHEEILFAKVGMWAEQEILKPAVGDIIYDLIDNLSINEIAAARGLLPISVAITVDGLRRRLRKVIGDYNETGDRD